MSAFQWTDERLRLLVGSYYDYLHSDECGVRDSSSHARCLEKLKGLFNRKPTDDENLQLDHFFNRVPTNKENSELPCCWQNYNLEILKGFFDGKPTDNEISEKLNEVASCYENKDVVTCFVSFFSLVVFIVKNIGC